MFDTDILERGLDVAALRQQVTANNIANLNTPGYRPQQVLFEDELRQSLGQARPRVVTLHHRVDIQNEMCTLSKNTIMYHALANKISGVFSLYRWIIDNAR
ncbi:MAG: flagellar basal body protein [Vulcanimicrobiota bacterium]